MAYVINRYNESVLTVVEDYAIDETLDIRLVGRHYIDYGEVQNENFVFLLENFSNPEPPERAISGQLWFDSYKNKLNVFDGDQFTSVGKPIISSYQPTEIDQGELWWNSASEQLHIYNGHDFVMVGPAEDPLGNIDFWWDDTYNKLYVKDGDDMYNIGPEIDDAIALAMIL